eukprot:GFUD01084367.1.p1 GENE.GFUD01084367.1~~GFUD01084367.1.p1  ORF type:complete len:519 (+),score=186.79 GFUD01084367.1:53-1558(+)
MWAEVALAKQEQRHELVLQGKDVQERVEKTGLDANIFKLDKLNFLNISQAKVNCIPDTLGFLTNLTSLVLKGNSLTSIPTSLNNLKKLKLLDLSLNSISTLPPIPSLTELTTLNLSLNNLSGEFLLEGIQNCQKLSLVDLTANTLTSLGDLQIHKLDLLAEVVAKQNKLDTLSHELLDNWPVLKKLDLAENCLKEVPGELGEMTKLKELNLVDNPLADNRLRKMCGQKGTKSVLDYVKSNCSKVGGGEKTTKGKGKKNKKGRKDSVDMDELCDTLTVVSLREDMPEIVATEAVKEVRPFIVFCFVTGLDLAGENLKKFLSMQTRLHKSVCANRTLATIATHDLSKVTGPLVYTSKMPQDLSIVPLSSPHPTRADLLVTQLKTEAEALRKEKKRNAVTGLHNYLHLLDTWTVYPCLMDGDKAISFPPVTNSGDTRICETTSSLLVEVTSSTKLGDAKMVLETLLLEMAGLLGGLEVVQGRVVVTYPAKTDLAGVKNLKVVRE